MPFEFGDVPGNLHFSKHSEVSGGVCGVGVKERAVPVEENPFERVVAGVFHEGLRRHIRTFQVYGKTGRPRKSVTRSRPKRAALRSEFRARGEVVRTDWTARRQLACLRQAGAFQKRLHRFEAQGKQKAAAIWRRAQSL